MTSTRRFASKIDAWLVIVLVVALLAELVALGMAVHTDPRPATVAIALGLTIVVYLFVGLLLARTYYEVDGQKLRIVCGVFSWTIPLDQIHSVEATRSPLSSPALSLDRLRIRYGKNRSMLVSPLNKPQFIAALSLGERKDRQ